MCNLLLTHLLYVLENNSEKLDMLDLKMMIYVLTQLNDSDQSEGNKDFVHQLDEINQIRRNIMQSSSGMLQVAKFQEIMQSISKVCSVMHH